MPGFEGTLALGWIPPDEDLVGAAIAGDDGAFSELIGRYRHTAVRVATRIIGAERAEDVVQDALLMAHEALDSIEDRSKFARWLYAITRFRALRTARFESRHSSGRVSLDQPLLETLSELACAPREQEDGDAALLAALERIPLDYAEAIRLRFLHGLPLQKIAEFLGVSVATVKWRCHHGKELLRGVVSGASRRTRRERPVAGAVFGRSAGPAGEQATRGTTPW